MYFSHSTDPLRYPTSPASDVGTGPPGVTTRLTSGYSSAVAPTPDSTTPLFASAKTSWSSSLVAGSGVGSSTLESIIAGIKRSSECRSNMKIPAVLVLMQIYRPGTWYDSTSHLPIYPQRPREKDCAYYMQTRTCKFGESCKFDHPIWVPEGGIPDWKEFYMKTGVCKFGASCEFHHPKDFQIQLAGQANGSGEQTQSNVKNDGITAGGQLVAHLASNVLASIVNSKGLPIRPGEVDCPFYLKTGSCKYGATFRYNHPDRIAINPVLAALGAQILGSPADLSFGVVNTAASLYQTIGSRLSHPTVGALLTVYGQRPGQAECEYYMKTGTCMFRERCKFHHPVDRTELSTQGVTLTPAGLPTREFGATCKFDHPPPEEVMTLSSLGSSTNPGEAKDGEKGA